MNIYERFLELIKECNEFEQVECHDSTTGTVYKNIKDLPIWFAEQPAKYAYFRFMPKIDSVTK